MSKYQEMTIKEVVSFRRLQLDNPNTSMRDGMVEILNHHIIEQTSRPTDTKTHKAVKGTIANYKETWDMIPYTPEELANNLQVAKEVKSTEIKRAFEKEAASTTVFNTNTFESTIETSRLADDKARLVIRAGEKAGGTAPFAVTFNDVDKVSISMTTDSLLDLSMQIGFEYETLFAKKTVKYAEINAATIDTIDNIIW